MHTPHNKILENNSRNNMSKCKYQNVFKKQKVEEQIESFTDFYKTI